MDKKTKPFEKFTADFFQLLLRVQDSDVNVLLTLRILHRLAQRHSEDYFVTACTADRKNTKAAVQYFKSLRQKYSSKTEIVRLLDVITTQPLPSHENKSLSPVRTRYDIDTVVGFKWYWSSLPRDSAQLQHVNRFCAVVQVAIKRHQRKSYDEAIDLYTTALQFIKAVDPRDVRCVRLNLANVYDCCQMHASAISEYSEVLETFPTDSVTRFRRAMMLYRLGDLNDSRKEFAAVQKTIPEASNAIKVIDFLSVGKRKAVAELAWNMYAKDTDIYVLSDTGFVLCSIEDLKTDTRENSPWSLEVWDILTQLATAAKRKDLDLLSICRKVDHQGHGALLVDNMKRIIDLCGLRLSSHDFNVLKNCPAPLATEHHIYYETLVDLMSQALAKKQHSLVLVGSPTRNSSCRSKQKELVQNNQVVLDQIAQAEAASYVGKVAEWATRVRKQGKNCRKLILEDPYQMKGVLEETIETTIGTGVDVAIKRVNHHRLIRRQTIEKLSDEYVSKTGTLAIEKMLSQRRRASVDLVTLNVQQTLTQVAAKLEAQKRHEMEVFCRKVVSDLTEQTMNKAIEKRERSLVFQRLCFTFTQKVVGNVLNRLDRIHQCLVVQLLARDVSRAAIDAALIEITRITVLRRDTAHSMAESFVDTSIIATSIAERSIAVRHATAVAFVQEILGKKV